MTTLDRQAPAGRKRSRGTAWPLRLVWAAVVAMTLVPMHPAGAADRLVVLLDRFVKFNVPASDQLIMVVNKDTAANPRYQRFLDAV